MADKKPRIKIKISFGKIAAIMIAVFAVLLTVDLVLKFCEVKYDWNFVVIPKLIWTQSGVQNTGAAFSFLADSAAGRIILIIITFIMLALIIFVFLILPERFIILKLALSMIAAGALGNLVDRLAFGYVRDFVWVNIFGKPACCNFADFWIVFGVILAVIDVLFLNEWAVIPLTKRAKAWAKELEREDDPLPSQDVEQPPQELDPVPEELLAENSFEEPSNEEAPGSEKENNSGEGE